MVPALSNDPLMCEPGGNGTLVLPLLESEQSWNKGLRIVLYAAGMIWCFMGVALISDIFMGAIEHITAQKVRKWSKDRKKYYTELVWNPTVSNLTLMALGSSAPEILLNVVETTATNKMFSGELGPATIVGSAAFNLLVIIAVCVSTIPDGEIRYIKELPVYAVTAVFSLFAYVWLVIVLLLVSPNIVEIWEGFTTLLLFPILVLIAFWADKGYLCGKSKESSCPMAVPEMSAEELAELQIRVRRENGPNITDEQVLKIIEAQNPALRTRAHYRVATTRAMTGGKRVPVDQQKSFSNVLALPFGLKIVPYSSNESEEFAFEGVAPGTESGTCVKENQCVIEFAAARHAVLENAENAVIKVVRAGFLETEATVSYRTRDGSAKAKGRQGPEEGNGDYIHTEGTLTFKKNESEKIIKVKILDDNTYEEDEDFFIDLLGPSCELDADGKNNSTKGVPVEAVLGTQQTTSVVIIDDDTPGTLAWEYEEIEVQERTEPTDVSFNVLRDKGSKNSISCKYRTENGTALVGKDYEETQGRICFEEGVTATTVKVKIHAGGRYGTSDYFRVILSDLEDGKGAKFNEGTDGGKDSCILTVKIVADKVEMERIDRMMQQLRNKWDKAKIGNSSWKEQFVAALYVNGGDDGEDGEEGEGDEKGDEDDSPSIADWAMHVITLPWKLVFAFCPPVDYCGGWVCFFTSLLMIGGVTALIGDLANLFGCLIPFMENQITAITFVALGTSMPDTFASKTAAMQDPYADASVGNVTGSNSVNVFLGLGLPWVIATMYWAFKGEHDEWDRRYQNDPDLPWLDQNLNEKGLRSKAYVVKSTGLVYSVCVFACCAIMSLATLTIRRRLVGGELGGPKRSKYLTSAFLVFLWFVYISLSVLRVKEVI